jgi:hypothetical protein
MQVDRDINHQRIDSRPQGRRNGREALRMLSDLPRE